MSETIPSDHPTVDSVRIECDQVGRTGRPQLTLPAGFDPDRDGYVRLVVDGETTYAPVETTLDGGVAIQGAYANRRLARTGEGRNLLREWLDTEGYGPGDTLVLDELTEGYAYGLREPGDRVVYDLVEKPDSSLADIAESLGE